MTSRSHAISPAPAPAGLSRRRLLTLGGAGLGALALPLRFAPGAAAASDPYAALRAAWSTYISGGSIDPSNSAYAPAIENLNSEAASYLSTIESGSGITSLWPDLPLGSVSGNITGSFYRLEALALAYVTPGTNYTANASLASTIVSGLDFLATGAYAPTVKPYNNWWDWQIGSSQPLGDTAVLMYSQLTSTQIANYCASIDAFVPDPTQQLIIGTGYTTSTGANRLDECRAVIVRGALGEDSTAISTGVADILPELPYVMCGDGLYADGSFTQHGGVAYTGTYGAIYFGDIVAMATLLQGSTWAIPAADLDDVLAGMGDGFAPVVYNGLMIDAVRGRAITRVNESDADDGFSAAINLLRWAQVNPDTAQAAQWQSVAKGWLQRNTLVPISYGGITGVSLAESVLNDSSIPAAAEPVAHHQFPNMARAIHRQPGWAYAVSMCSKYVDRYEVINGENLHGWHTGDGMGYLYLDNDIAQYNDAFWDTVDMYRLPGTTADSGALADSVGASTKPSATWVGGSVVADAYGAVGMQFQDYSTDLTAVKSWFCLDAGVVCLGAGITSTSGNAVITTVENRNVHAAGSNTLSINGTAQSTSPGWSSTVSAVHYANISGVAGYYFLWPAGANDIEFALTNQTGSWSEVTTGGSTTTDTRPYTSIAFDHGANPTNATYSYVILPNYTEAETAAYAANPTVSVIANEPTFQAITDASLGVTVANFFAADTAGPITVNAPASVTMQVSGSDLTIAVSDPTWTAATVQVTIAESGYTSIVSADPSVTVLSSSGGSIKLLVEAGGSRGASHSVTLSSAGTALTASTAYLLSPTDNTYVRGGTYDTENFNGGTTMVVKNSGGSYDRVSLLKFSTTGVTGTVARAILWVNGYVADSGGDQTSLTAYALSNDTWSASSVTFNTAPSVTTAYGSGPVSNTADWVGLDVTGLVAPGGETAVGIWQESTSTCLAVLLYTTTEGSAYSPVLEVITN